jgi:hypothetical protein
MEEAGGKQMKKEPLTHDKLLFWHSVAIGALIVSQIITMAVLTILFASW